MKKHLQKSANSAQPSLSRPMPAASAPDAVHEALTSPGQPLDSATRAFFEPRFGHDFSQVRVHTDAKAAQSAFVTNKLAYTVGRDIVFGERQYAPGTTMGSALLAHELTHVVQQRSASRAHADGLEIGSPNDAAEYEANRVAAEVLAARNPIAEHSNSTQPDEIASVAPEYLRSMLAKDTNRHTEHRQVLEAFRREHSDDLLERYWMELGESTSEIKQVEHISPLQRIRVAGCERAPSQREQMQQSLPGNDEMVREIFVFFYPDLTPLAKINDSLRDLAAVMLAEAIRGSRAMDYIPRPPRLRPGPAWLFTEPVKIAWRRGRDEGIYVAVRNQIARAHRSEYELAKEGIE